MATHDDDHLPERPKVRRRRRLTAVQKLGDLGNLKPTERCRLFKNADFVARLTDAPASPSADPPEGRPYREAAPTKDFFEFGITKPHKRPRSQGQLHYSKREKLSSGSSPEHRTDTDPNPNTTDGPHSSPNSSHDSSQQPRCECVCIFPPPSPRPHTCLKAAHTRTHVRAPTHVPTHTLQ